MAIHNQRIGVLAAITAVAVLSLLFAGPIPQDPDYHTFADIRQLLGVSNFWNVISNIPFVIVGALGFTRFSRLAHRESATEYLVICVGVVLVGFGSAYYHHDPSHEALLWDRLPITVAFMALLSLLLGERVLQTRHPQLLSLLVTLGAASALYWSWTESLGRGDLRPYVLVQFLPVLLMPLILMMFRQRYLSNALLFTAFVLYFAAKVLEYLDAEIFAMLGFISGHAIKHVAAAAAVLCIILAVPTQPTKRQTINT